MPSCLLPGFQQLQKARENREIDLAADKVGVEAGAPIVVYLLLPYAINGVIAAFPTFPAFIVEHAARWMAGNRGFPSPKHVSIPKSVCICAQ